MKKYKSMFIFLGVLIALVGVYFLLTHINQKGQDSKEDEGYKITAFDEIASMEYTDGEKTMSFSLENGKWNTPVRGDAKLDTDKINDIADALKTITAIRVLEGADEISAYGLDEPKYTIKIESKNGDKITIYVGNAVGNNFYATANEKIEVYVIDSTVVNSLVFDVDDLISQE